MTPSIPASVDAGLSVVVPTHNPRPELLPGLIAALAAQTLDRAQWELVLVDNASTPPLAPDFAPLVARGVPCRIVREPRPGLTYARLAGFAHSTRPLVVLLDDDNLPRPDFFARALHFASTSPRIGAFGGRVLPRYANPPPPWFAAVGLGLGCRDFGDQPLFATAQPPPSTYPRCAPVGAGMVLRREVTDHYVRHVAAHPGALTDRQGKNLSSGGDCEIVLVGLRHGWDVAYAPELIIDHLIPPARLQPAYLARLNHDSSRSWVVLLHRFDLNPWPAISPVTLPLRKLRSWFFHRAWRGPRERIAWAGACGLLEGRADLHPSRSPDSSP